MMIARKLRDRLKNLTGALIEEDDLDAAWLASVLVAAQDSIENGRLGDFALQVWRADQARQEATAEAMTTWEIADLGFHVPRAGRNRMVLSETKGIA
jgi:hypothetical protein